jgi:type IV pilus assembly protein PilA
MKMQKGFTLIELMIVVAIIAILAAIAISQYQDYVIRSQVSEGSSLADGVKTAVGEFYNNYGRFPNGSGNANISLGLAIPNSISGSYVGSVIVANTGIISARYESSSPNKANVKIDGTALTFSPITKTGSMVWTCKPGSTVLQNKWLPASCRP